MWYDNDRCVHLCHKDAMGERGRYPLYQSIWVQSIVQSLQYVAWTYHFVFKAHRMAASKGMQHIKLICEKIQHTKSFSSEKPRRFGALNLFVNQFDVLNPFALGHPRSFKYDMGSSGNILEALTGGLHSDGSIRCISSMFHHSILMT